MKKNLLSLLFLCMVCINQIWAGAGIWHSSINLTLNGQSVDYKITENSTYFDNDLPTSMQIAPTSITINQILVDVWKDGNGNICGGTYDIIIKDANNTEVSKKSLVITWDSEYDSEFNSKNQVWKNTTTTTIDISELAIGQYTLSISGHMTGSNSNANDCSEIFNDASISCQLIISNNIPENPNPNPEPEPEPDSTYMSSVPSECEDVMLQGFYWDSHDSQAKYGDTRWSTLCSQTSEISAYFDLVWLPPSSQSTGGLGYHPTHWNNQSGNLGNETQLKELITRLHNNGTQVIADIVINHRGNKSSWCDFPIDDFGEFGEFQLTSDHIVGNDEVNFDAGAGECKGAARGANDTGEQYGAARDLDHTNSYVRDAIKAYLRWLKSEFGYDGWRYDVAKGFSAKYFNEYNIASQIQFSVGEYYDGNPNALKNWINGTNKNSLAFDFATKFTAFNQGIANNDYNKLKGAGLLGLGYSRYAVTFIDNHDTFERSENNNDFTNIDNKDKILQANAYLLSMPGIPCVFYPHWIRYKDDIKPMINARRACGIHSESRVTDEIVSYDKYEATIHGKNGTLILKIGSGSSYNTTPSGYTKVASGSNYAIFISTTSVVAPRLIVSPEGGLYEGGTEVTLSSTNNSANIYYTLDGTEPTTESLRYTTAINITQDSTILKAFAEYNSAKSDIQTHIYTTQKPIRNEAIKVSFLCPNDWTQVNLWAWDDDGNNIYGGGQWPGKPITNEGNGWWSHTFNLDITSVNILFNNGATPTAIQTADIIGVTESTCYIYNGEKEKPKVSNDCNTTVDIENTTSQNILIYPNPTNDILNIESNNTIKTIRIVNSTGLILYELKVDSTLTSINTANLPSGLYLIQTITSDEINNQTIIKK
jgi:alpha-amylase